MAKATFGLHFGAFADSLAKQLRQQGLKFKLKSDAIYWQKMVDSAIGLHLGGLLTDKEQGKVYDRIIKRIGKDIEPRTK